MPTNPEAQVKAIVELKGSHSISGAISKANGDLKNNKQAELDLPPSDRFYKVLKKAGITDKQLANSLAELLKANRITVDKFGKITEQPDNMIRLKTVELLLKYFAPENTTTQNHLHLHGKKLDELLAKDSGA